MDDRSPASRHGHNIKEGTCSYSHGNKPLDLGDFHVVSIDHAFWDTMIPGNIMPQVNPNVWVYSCMFL